MKQSTLAKEFEDSKINCENLTDPLEVSKQENDTIVEKLENKVIDVEQCEFGIGEENQIKETKGSNFENEPENSNASMTIDIIDKNKDPYKCKICSKSCISNSDLRVHRQSHITATRKYLDQQYQNEISNANVKIDSGEKSFHCQTCKKGFAKYSYLKQHERIHSEEKPFKCDICKKKYKHD